MGSDNRLYKSDSPFFKFINFVESLVEKPVVWFRETIVEPNRQEYYWYHEKIRRVPTVDECYSDDVLCVYEADIQFLNDRVVDLNILHLLKKRYDRCLQDNPCDKEDCTSLYDNWLHAKTNFFIKYGDLGWAQRSKACLMKQKHRMAWERRHGPVGSGKRHAKEEKGEKPKKEEKSC